MRIALTVESSDGSDDVLVDCDDAATVEELEHALCQRLGRRVRVPGASGTSVVSGMVNGVHLGARGRRRAHPSGLQVHVVSGPDSGAVLSLPPGEQVMGRSGELAWADPGLSRRHLKVRTNGQAVEVCDLDSRHGTTIDGRRCMPGTWIRWCPGELLEVGNSAVEVTAAAIEEIQSEATGSGWRRILRPPRLMPVVDEAHVDFPEAPRLPERRGLPVIAMIVPLMVGVVIAAVMRRPEYLLFTLASPLLVCANFIAGRVGGSRRYSAAMAEYAKAYAASERALAVAVTAEEHRLRALLPDAAATLLTARVPGRRLWERRRDDHDYLRLRIGTADKPSTVTLGGVGASPLARSVPHAVELGSAGTLGIVGPPGASDGVLRWLMAQVAVHHAPRDVSMVFLSHDADESWTWLQWLPHLAPQRGQPCVALIGNDSATLSARVDELGDLIRSRSRLVGSRADAAAPASVVMVIRNYRDVAAVVDLTTIVRDGPRVGVYVMCTAAVDLELPEHTQALVAVVASGGRASVIDADGQRVDDVRLEQVAPQWMQHCARSLAAFRDVAGEEAQELSANVRLLDLLNPDWQRPDRLRERWQTQGPRAIALLGMSASEQVSVDLASSGPHALIAGTTGSGKSELLQSMVVSMAVATSPDWLSLLLVDYKGDSAFGACADLPHVVGKVNDLDSSLVERALASLRAELAFRKDRLAEAKVKDIDDYHALLLAHPRMQRLPRLVIVIDEFAELSRELPEFVDGLVSVAQLGRSLGVHLVLATQRPQGVVSAAIRANTSIRVALRVMDSADSSDVVGVPDAAQIPANAPGRGLLRLDGQSATCFQTARVNVRGCVTTRPRLRVAPLEWPALGREPALPEIPGDEKGPSDLTILVDHVRAAAADWDEPRRPWLDPLPARLLWGPHGVAAQGELPPLAFGLTDHPDRQRQEPEVFDIARDGHLFLIGARGSGRSQALRTIAGAVARLISAADVHLYGLDCASGALGVLTHLPHCGVVVSRSETARACRLLTRLVHELESRQARFGAEGVGDLSEQRRQGVDPLPHIVLMVDGWDGFASTLGQFPEQLEAMMRLLREGASVGIHLLVTGDRSLIANARLSAMAERKYLLRLTDRSDYALAGHRVPRTQVPGPPGRCYGPEGRETQIYLLAADPAGQAQAGALRNLAELASQRPLPVTSRPFRIDALPTRLSVQDALSLAPHDESTPFPIVGVGGDELVAFIPEMATASCFPVVGPRRSGRSSVLLGAALSVLATGGRVVAIAPRGGPLARLSGRPEVAVFGAGVDEKDVRLAVAGRAAVLIIDDADLLAASDLDDYLLSVAKGGVPEVFLLVAGTAEGLAGGFNNWQAQTRRSRQGLLLSPRAPSDGDLVGLRLSRSDIGGPVRPGFGLLHRGDGVPIPVATVLGHSESD